MNKSSENKYNHIPLASDFNNWWYLGRKEILKYLITKENFKLPIKILEIGPDDFVTKALFDRKDIEYTSVDIERSNATQKMDLTNLNYPDDSFDNIFDSVFNLNESKIFFKFLSEKRIFSFLN